MEHVKHTEVEIVNEIIRLTVAKHIKWVRCVVNDNEHNFYQLYRDLNGNEVKSVYVRYNTNVLGKPVYLGELDCKPKWVIVDDERICYATDDYLKQYITNPVKSLWRLINDKAVDDSLSVSKTEWLQKLKETNNKNTSN